MMQRSFDVAVIGAGPAGLAAAIAAADKGASVLLIERESRLGGILKQCIHDGFGLLRFGEKLAGPEYAYRFTSIVAARGINVQTETFVSQIEKTAGGFLLTLTCRDGLMRTDVKRIVFATGCRERTARQIGVHGRKAAGIFTAGTAQYYVNVLGFLPTRRCVILGSGDIGLIMARRLTLEGAKVQGVYEAKPAPGGLTRNIQQCLVDFDIPLHLSTTVTRTFGEGRLTGVEVAMVDENMRPIPGTEQRIDCDALILSVGLIPENELLFALGAEMDAATHGPVADQFGETSVPGVFCAGNALTVYDLVDYVSESGERAGERAARLLPADAARLLPADAEHMACVRAGAGVSYVLPQRIRLDALAAPVPFFFRTMAECGESVLTVSAGERVLLQKRFSHLRPPEMERLAVDLSHAALAPGDAITFALAEVKE